MTTTFLVIALSLSLGGIALAIVRLFRLRGKADPAARRARLSRVGVVLFGLLVPVQLVFENRMSEFALTGVVVSLVITSALCFWLGRSGE